jgi:deoxyribodipyrimidine photo-lyase
MGPLQIVWFKRDLRTVDHQPLLQASRQGPVLPLMVVEPELWRQSDASARQWCFCAESLAELRHDLDRLGLPLVVRVGEVEAVLERAHRRFGVAGLWSHEETGNAFTYARDRRIRRWAARHGIPWVEIPAFGVVRRLASRDGWARRWEERMALPLVPPPTVLPPAAGQLGAPSLAGIDPGGIPVAAELGLAPDPCPGRQEGGRRAGLELLESFLAQRGAEYHRQLSSPTTAFEGCSRLSPHLAWGTLSLREVVQASRRRRAALAALPPVERGGWPRALRAFEERLHWHCHFIQKLECQPDLEFRELHPLTVDPHPGDPAWLEAWAAGRTGLPFVDACMRALIATGWINFRMRAMLLSVASHHLRLPWRQSGLHLARLFLDYEPGIHWSQCQMQAGTTGINTIRIYNPIKQGQDHDPQGAFLMRWLPELRGVPLVHRHQPWTMDLDTQHRFGCLLGRDYPTPIVAVEVAAREARERLWARRSGQEFAAHADGIQRRHGSRRSGLSPTGRRRKERAKEAVGAGGAIQLGLDLALPG